MVSRGFQRFFASGELLQICDVVPRPGTKRIRLAGTRDVFAVKDFSSFRTSDGTLVDPLEDQWRDLESAALPVVRGWLHGQDEPYLDRELKVLAALHAVRSFGFNNTHARVSAELRQTALNPDRIARLRISYLDEFGTEPRQGEIEERVLELYDDQWGSDGMARIEGMVQLYNTALEMLAPKFIRVLIVAPGVPHQFVLGDTPFVHFRHHDLDIRVGLKAGLPLGEGHTIFMPVSPKVAVEFNSDEMEFAEVPAWGVQALNWISWRAAFSQVAAHPSADLERCLATRLPDS